MSAVDSSDPAPTSAPLPAPPAPTPPNARRAPLSALAITLGLIAMGGAGYAIYHADQLRTAMAVDVAAAVQRADRLDEANRALQRQLDQTRAAQQASNADLAAELGAQQRRLDTTQQRLDALASIDRRNWQLAEAEYLLQMANQRVLMAAEPRGAVALLIAADGILRGFDDDALFNTRQALAAEIAALKAVDDLDVQGLFARIDAAAKLAAELHLIQPPPLHVAAPAAEAANWRERIAQGWQRALDTLAASIRIHRRDDIYRPTLAPDQEAAVRHNVQLLFEQAQLALLASNQPMYTRSLERARQWLGTYYTLDTNATAATIAAIDDVIAADIDRELPDISTSRRLLKHYLDTVHQAPVVTRESTP